MPVRGAATTDGQACAHCGFDPALHTAHAPWCQRDWVDTYGEDPLGGSVDDGENQDG